MSTALSFRMEGAYAGPTMPRRNHGETSFVRIGDDPARGFGRPGAGAEVPVLAHNDLRPHREVGRRQSPRPNLNSPGNGAEPSGRLTGEHAVSEFGSKTPQPSIVMRMPAAARHWRPPRPRQRRRPLPLHRCRGCSVPRVRVSRTGRPRTRRG